MTSIEKLSPLSSIVFIFRPNSIALKSSMSSINSKGVCFDFANFNNACGLKEIIERCLYKNLFFFYIQMELGTLKDIGPLFHY